MQTVGEMQLVAQAYEPTNQEVEAGGLRVQGLSGLQSEFIFSPGNLLEPISRL